MFTAGVTNIIVTVKNANNEVLGTGNLASLKRYSLYPLALQHV